MTMRHHDALLARTNNDVLNDNACIHITHNVNTCRILQRPYITTAQINTYTYDIYWTLNTRCQHHMVTACCLYMRAIQIKTQLQINAYVETKRNEHQPNGTNHNTKYISMGNHSIYCNCIIEIDVVSHDSIHIVTTSFGSNKHTNKETHVRKQNQLNNNTNINE